MRPMKTELENIRRRIVRRLWHILGGSFFPVLALFISREALLIAIGSVTVGFLLGEVIRLAFPAVNRRMILCLSGALKDDESYQPTSSTYLLISTLLVFLLFDKYIAIAALFFLAIGDLTASVVGETWGRRRLWHKTLEGSLACLVTCLAIGMFLAGLDLISPPVIIVGAIAATVTEVLPLHIDDNLTMPLASAGAMASVSLLWH